MMKHMLRSLPSAWETRRTGSWLQSNPVLAAVDILEVSQQVEKFISLFLYLFVFLCLAPSPLSLPYPFSLLHWFVNKLKKM